MVFFCVPGGATPLCLCILIKAPAFLAVAVFQKPDDDDFSKLVAYVFSRGNPRHSSYQVTGKVWNTERPRCVYKTFACVLDIYIYI